MKNFLIAAVVIGVIAVLSLDSQSKTLSQNQSVSNLPIAATAPMPTTQPKPSDRAVLASVGAYSLMNNQQKQNFLNKYATDSHEVADAVVNLAFLLDRDNETLVKIEAVVKSRYSSSGVNSGNVRSDEAGSSYSNDYDSGSSLKYNSFSNKWEYAGEDESLQYNAMENRWEYAADDESTRYNAMENRWEFAGDDESTKYNAMKNTWEYAPDDYTTKYNAMENKWETTSQDSTIQYNAMEGTWSYEE